MPRRRSLLAGALLAWLAGAAAAHDTWLLPDAPAVAAGEPLGLSLASGIVFPIAEAGASPGRLAAARFRQQGGDHPLLLPRPHETGLRLRLVPRGTGVTAAWVTLRPFEVDIEDEIVQVYFDEINADAALRALWARAGPGRHWQERYVKHAKTFVRVGAAAGDAADWRQPVGAPYEIVPLADPTRLRAGDELPVQVLRRGRALPALELAAIHDGSQRGPFVATGADGRARLRLDRPGWWLLRGTELRPPAAGATHWESDWVSLSVFVAP